MSHVEQELPTFPVYEPTNSVYVTFMIPEWCIDVLMKIQPEDKARLNSFGVDRFKVGDDYVDCKGRTNKFTYLKPLTEE
jgi:hypothetical protein